MLFELGDDVEKPTKCWQSGRRNCCRDLRIDSDQIATAKSRAPHPTASPFILFSTSLPRASSHVLSAVDLDFLTGHVACRIRTQEEDDARDLVRRADPAHRDRGRK